MSKTNAKQVERCEIILDQIERVATELNGVTFQDFQTDRSKSDLAAFRVQVIGENCHHLGDQVKERHPSLPWPDIYGMRNIIAHDYNSINPKRVWQVARDYLAPVRDMARQELDLHREAVQRERGHSR